MGGILSGTLVPVSPLGEHSYRGPVRRFVDAVEDAYLAHHRRRHPVELYVVESHQSHVKVLSYDEAVARRAARRPPDPDSAA